jgi:hypothetical protein
MSQGDESRLALVAHPPCHFPAVPFSAERAAPVLFPFPVDDATFRGASVPPITWRMARRLHHLACRNLGIRAVALRGSVSALAA